MTVGIGQETPHPSIARDTTHTGRRISIYWAVAPLVLLDGILVGLSLIGAYVIRFRFLAYQAPLSAAFYVRLGTFAIPMWLLIFSFYYLYHPDRLFGGLKEYSNVLNGCTAGTVSLILFSFLGRRAEPDISRGWLALVWLLSVTGITGARFCYRRLIYRLRRRGFFVRRALIVGANEEGRAVVAQLHDSPAAGIEIVGFLDGAQPVGTRLAGRPVVGRPGDLASLARQMSIEELIVIPTALRREELLDLYRDWGTDTNTRIRLSSGLYELFTTGVQVQEVGFIPLVSLNRTRITGIDAALKAALDRIGALMIALLLFPLLLLIGVAVWLDSGRPIFYRRRVVGLHGRIFHALKFRTMVEHADTYLETHPHLKEEWERTGKIQDDPRVTRVGRRLRRYSLDELPQLFNVLRGQMSLVGPRMITPAELRHFGRWQHNLLTVKPGMTGLWQISGRANLSYEDRVRLDMHYIRNYTIWLDFRLLFNTVRAVIRGRGAY